MTALDLLTPAGGQTNSNGRFYGVAIGIVTDNKDPQGLARVKVKFPWFSEKDTSSWARIVMPMTGKERGIYCLPDLDDEVLVAFSFGDINDPYIIGSLWNGKDKPPETNSDGKNNRRLIKSRSGHTVIFDDTEGAEKIIIRDKTENNEIIIDSSTNTMTLKAEQDIAIEAKGSISLKSSGGDIAIAGKNINLKAEQNCQIEATAQCKLQANSGLSIKCLAGVKINDGALEVM